MRPAAATPRSRATSIRVTRWPTSSRALAPSWRRCARAPATFRSWPAFEDGPPSAEDSPAAWDRLLADLADLAPPPGAIVLDGGNHPDRTARRLWQAADLLLLVTTSETTAVMGAYASVKLLAESGNMAPIHLLVNMADSLKVAEEVYGRLAKACRRFLALPLLGAGCVPADVRLLEAAATGHASGSQFRHLAQRVMSEHDVRTPSAA